LKTWTHLHDITVSNCGECPDFFEMPVDGNPQNKRWVWTAANGHYLVGRFDGKKFTPETGPHRADWGANYYAVQTYSDIPPSDGRRIQIAWLSGGKYPQMPFNQQMSFPCELRLCTFPEGLRICRLPVKEIEGLHEQEMSCGERTVKPGDNLLAGITGELFDIRAEFELGDATEFGFTLRGEPVTYSAKDKAVTGLGRSGPLEPVANRIKLQVLLDRSSIEVFGNDGRLSMTSCFLPRVGNKALELSAKGGQVKVLSLKVYPLRSAWGRVGEER
jgi:sucrose-6-phosphate hydrolase SacC (GH32 family)